jgi:hypothetical protein
MWTLLRLNLKTSQYQQISNELKTLKNQNETLKKTIDTLNDELFKKEIELFRRERAYEIFKEKNPMSASQFGDIISDETE